MTGRIAVGLGKALAFLGPSAPGGRGVLPWLITQWRPCCRPTPRALRWAGLILIARPLVVVPLHGLRPSSVEGLGTPAPVCSLETWVVSFSGFYRFVRNPMYVVVAAMIFGQAVLFASWGVALYGLVIVAAFHTFVRLYEEPECCATPMASRTPPIARPPPASPSVPALGALAGSKRWGAPDHRDPAGLTGLFRGSLGTRARAVRPPPTGPAASPIAPVFFLPSCRARRPVKALSRRRTGLKRKERIMEKGKDLRCCGLSSARLPVCRPREGLRLRRLRQGVHARAELLHSGTAAPAVPKGCPGPLSSFPPPSVGLDRHEHRHGQHDRLPRGRPVSWRSASR